MQKHLVKKFRRKVSKKSDKNSKPSENIFRNRSVNYLLVKNQKTTTRVAIALMRPSISKENDVRGGFFTKLRDKRFIKREGFNYIIRPHQLLKILF